MSEIPPISVSHRTARPGALDYVLLVLLAVVWGASYTFLKIGVETIPPITLIAVRTLIAGLLLFFILHMRDLRLPRDGASWWMFAVQAVLGSVVPFTLIAWGTKTIDAGLTTILNSTTPIFAFLFTFLITRHEPATPRKWFGVCAGMVGIMLIIGVSALASLGQEIAAQFAIVAASALYGLAAIYGRHFNGLDPMLPATGSLLIGAVMLAPFSLIIDRPWTLVPSRDSIVALIALAIFSTALGLVIYYRLLSTLGSVGTVSQGYLRAPIGVGVAMLLLGERPSWEAGLGLVLVLIGVMAMTFPEKKAR